MRKPVCRQRRGIMYHFSLQLNSPKALFLFFFVVNITAVLHGDVTQCQYYSMLHIFFSPADYTKITDYFLSKAHGLLSSNWCLQIGSGSVRLFHNNRVNKAISDMFRQRSQRRFTSSSLDKKITQPFPRTSQLLLSGIFIRWWAKECNEMQWNVSLLWYAVSVISIEMNKSRHVRKHHCPTLVSGDWNISSFNLLAWLTSF